MGTLYLVVTPAVEPEDLTFRARRILGTAAIVAATDAATARYLPASLGRDVQLVSALGEDALLDALEEGDVALLLAGWAPGPDPATRQLVCAALERDFPVVPVPGPSLPLAALVVSGLPAGGFVHLGELPRDPRARRALLGAVAAEQRTLLLLVSALDLAGVLAEMQRLLGDRQMAVALASVAPGMASGIAPWRGTVGEAVAQIESLPAGERLVLVVDGARQAALRWGPERLAAEIRARLEEGQAAGEVSRQLAAESGWSRREIYRLVIEAGRPDPGG